MRPICLLILAAALSGCGLTPKQLKALDGVMCHHGSGYGITSTTVVVGGASKGKGTQVTPDCGVVTLGR